MKNVTKIFVGVDVSKDSLDIALYPTKKHFKVPNNEFGISNIIKELLAYEVVRITCESSGGYERIMVKILRKAKYKVELVDPKLVKYFILSKKIKVKTDKIDSYMIALYASSNEPKYVQNIKSEEDEELRDLIRMRYNFMEDIAKEKKRLKQVVTKVSKDLITNHILHLKSQINIIDNKIKDIVTTNENWNKKFNILKSIPGIGNVTAAALIAEMSELGSIENKQAAALLGVAPYTKQSGNYEGKSMISGGRFMIRKIVYMGALSACHSKSRFAEYYNKLKSKGKKPKVCIVAVMNKIISVANALIKKNEMWNPNFI